MEILNAIWQYVLPIGGGVTLGALIIGILVLCAGIYYLVTEKHDPESKKIYTLVSVVGGVIAAVCAALLLL